MVKLSADIVTPESNGPIEIKQYVIDGASGSIINGLQTPCELELNGTIETRTSLSSR
jgi:hypothetical protein